MQCPTCGKDTPGTLGTCSHCEAPIDVYSVGPVGPLAAPVADTSATGAASGAATGSTSTGTQPFVPPDVAPHAQAESAAAADPSSSSGTGGMPTVSTGGMPAVSTGGMPVVGSPSERPVLRLSVEPPDSPAEPSAQSPGTHQSSGTHPAGPPSAGSESTGPGPAVPGSTGPSPTVPEAPGQSSMVPESAPASTGSGSTQTSPSVQPPADPEDTAAWTFNPDEDDDEPAASAPSGGASAEPGPVPNAFGAAPQPEPREPIVPESWFARPRKPDPQDVEPTQTWGAQQPGAEGQQSPDSGATQIAPPMPDAGAPGGPPSPMGYPGDLEQTRMDQGSPMGGPPMGAPMEQGAPMGQGMPMGPMGGPGQGPGDPAFGVPPQGASSGGGTSKPLLAAVAALVTVAVGSVVFVLWPSGDNPSASAQPTASSSPSNKQVAQKNQIPTETKRQAAVLNKILDDSVATRRVLAGALSRAGKCKTLPQAIKGFEQVAQRRRNQIARTRNLEVDKLANGERLRASLTEALTASLQVDQVLLQWARKNRRNCKGRPKPSAAQVPGRAAIERRATTAKQRFVVLWNPVAKKTGQPQRSWKRV
ncbi:MAG TPA: hypothetical protein VIL71_06360 [Spirillospora sp.]